MRCFTQINDCPGPSPTRLDSLAEQFVAKPFNLRGSLDDDDVLIVETTDLGIVVCTVDFIVVDCRLPDELVIRGLRGPDRPLHRRCLVPLDVATPAVVRFLRCRDTPAGLGWIPLSKMREWEIALEPELLGDDKIMDLWYGLSHRRLTPN